jgi:hypothetical protein
MITIVSLEMIVEFVAVIVAGINGRIKVKVQKSFGHIVSF